MLGGDISDEFHDDDGLTDAGTTEETLLTVIHPSGGRRLDLVYTYPAGDDSGERVTGLIGLLAEVEALTPSPPAAER